MEKTTFGVNEQTPRQIVAELDKYIVGQDEAKKSVAKFGGNWNNGSLVGPFYLNVNNASSNSNTNIGAH